MADAALNGVVAAPRADIVVVSFNGERHLTQLLPELRNSRGAHVRVIVVDNGSRDGSCSLASRAGADVICIGYNSGYGHACNVGLRSGEAPWVAFANQDLKVNADTVRQLIEGAVALELATGRPVVVGPRLVDTDGATQETFHRFPTVLRQSLELVAGARIAGQRDQPADEHHPQDWVSGACILGRREVFEAVGGFDETYFMYVEDVDLFRRLAYRGVGCGWLKDVVIEHERGAGAARPQTQAQVMASWPKYFISHHGRGSGFVILAAATIGSLTHAGLWATRALLGNRQARAYVRMFLLGPVHAVLELRRKAC